MYSYNGEGDTPEFELLQSVSTLAKKEDGSVSHNAASGLALAPDGKDVYKRQAVDRAMEKVVNKMLFGLRDSMNEQAFLECVAGLEKTYEK